MFGIHFYSGIILGHSTEYICLPLLCWTENTGAGAQQIAISRKKPENKVINYKINGPKILFRKF